MMATDMEHEDRREASEASQAAHESAPGEAQAAESDSANGDVKHAEALATLMAERDEFKDRTLRTLAEMENLRRRTEREVADARTYAVTNFARDLLTAADNIRRAIESVPADARETADGAFKALLDGIELTERDLAKTFERHGVKLLEPKGQKFDPNRHQAMFEVPDAEVPSGTVVQVMQAGYVLGDRVLRPALVGVAKGGPKAAAGPAADDAA
ncbi:nucleotide exchange factor GrpE [Methylobacterium sp. Leaf466]|uniref:nucleotide exchange factor GrpE n=1 Tax=Methylobacterium sp. Leaf466 TaxID=1736386 RepID=UPI0006F3F80A|nr:nucleotide exchange factor GrpE [Methylobacterium sp. Leaf466]KQT78468.1 molecular chaperone GrpE [Methylobacterium sp. Leaf466]